MADCTFRPAIFPITRNSYSTFTPKFTRQKFRQMVSNPIKLDTLQIPISRDAEWLVLYLVFEGCG
eukprot:20802-Amorphochlora_amoeboformis.AAC.1